MDPKGQQCHVSILWHKDDTRARLYPPFAVRLPDFPSRCPVPLSRFLVPFVSFFCGVLCVGMEKPQPCRPSIASHHDVPISCAGFISLFHSARGTQFDHHCPWTGKVSKSVLTIFRPCFCGEMSLLCPLRRRGGACSKMD